MKWEKIIIAIVSAAFAVILFILLPVESNKYRLKVVKEDSYRNLVNLLYADMDGDLEEELIRCKKNFPVPAIVVQKLNYQALEQWNLNGEWVLESGISFSDFDHDGYKEIVCFTFHQDSIWIHVFEPMQEGGIVIHKALDRVRLFNGNQDWLVKIGTPTDINGDGYDDYILTIRSGFTIQPREIYLFDPFNRKTYVMDTLVGNIFQKPILLDLDGDGHMEITGSVSSPGNITERDVYLSDSCSWLMVFDHHLHFKSAPLPYFGKPSYLVTLPLKKDSRQLLISSIFIRRGDSIINLMEIREWIDDSLQVISSRYLDHDDQIELVGTDPSANGSFYVQEGGDIIKLDLLLEEQQRIKMALSEDLIHLSLDVDGDGSEERIIYAKSRQLMIAKSDFSHPIALDLGFHVMKPQISVFKADGNSYLNVFRGHQNQLLSYSKNPFYSFRYLILVLSFIAYYVIFTLVANFQRKRIEKRQASEKQVLHYQLTNVMQQLDPHFLFNALTSISSYYQKGDQEHAHSYLAKVSRLVRTSLENSERMTISLAEEITFVNDYLTVELIRMGERMEFAIEVDEAMQQEIQIPKMLIQNFVENAVKHGIRHLKDKKGMIRVFSVEEKDYFQISIEDNGVGRKKAGEIGSLSTGNGLNMVRKTLGIFEKLEKIRITFEIEDLGGKGEALIGTRVNIRIPKKK